jgi:predicted dehydrogenase
MRKIGLGIIGCGIAARKLHLPALRRLNDRYDIVAVCNHTKPKAASFSRLVGGVPYDLDYRNLLDRPDVEAVDIVLPIDLNYRVTRDALAAGKHVILEKPLAANLREGKEMLTFGRKFRKVLMVAENCRYQPLFLRIAALLNSNAIGRPYAVVWNIFHRITADSPYAQTSWRIHHRYPGGFITDSGVHNMAVLRTLFGEFRWISAFTRCVNPSIGKLDTLGMQFATRGGVEGTLHLFLSVSGHAMHRISIFGTGGTIVTEDNTITLQRDGRRPVVERTNSDGGYIGEFTDFYRAITRGTPVRSTFREGYRDLEAILMALESAKRGSRLALR